MSHPLVSHSEDLRKLEQEGYDLEIRSDNLLIKHVPYVAPGGSVQFGILVSELSHNGTATITPRTHEIWFAGSYPCDRNGTELGLVINQRVTMDFGEGVIASCSFSQKPPSGSYTNYYDKVKTYVRILSGHAKAIDPTVTARTYPPHQTAVEESVFRYLDAASSRAGIGAVTAKLKLGKVAIVGLGGTGAYILDLVAKTPVSELHLYDDDVLFAHNAFRTPGAASLEELAQMPRKVDYLRQKYDPFRRNIIAHPEKVSRSNIEELQVMNFVFLAMDTGSAKELIVEHLESYGVPFIDCGMGIYRQDNALGGILRVTTSTDGHRSHIKQRISFADENEDEYNWNIQTADLNMLNAAMAVVKWKKLFGYYIDRKNEYNSMYTVTRNQMVSGDLAE